MSLERLFEKYRLPIFLCFLYVCSAQVIIATEEEEDKKPSAIDVAAQTVLYLEFEQHASEIREINGIVVEFDLYLKVPGREEYLPKRIGKAGTGFIVKSGVVPYVVTAGHLVKNNKSLGQYWINPVKGEIVNGTFEDILAKLKGAKWFFHKNADIAIHPVSLPQREKGYRIFPKDTFSDKPIELLTFVCVPGFPYALGKDNIRLGPLVETCDIASWPAILRGNPKTKVIFLSERLANGYSGAPVCSIRNPPSYGRPTKHTMKLVGIQSGAQVFSKQEKGIVIQDEFSYIVPVSYLIELLNSKEVQEFEQDFSIKRKAD